MRNIFCCLVRFFISVLAIAFSYFASAQEVIDSVQFRAVYGFSYKINPEQTAFAKTDLMYLDIGQKVSKFYSRNEHVRDSIANDGLSKGLSAFEINEQRRGFDRGTRPIYYNYQKEAKTTVTSNFVFHFTYYDEKMQLPEWKIGNEKSVILGYNCKKASTNYFGRQWDIYFTTEIPINQGPWKLWGLPGLILKATDKDSLFKYELLSFEKLENDVPITFVLTTSDEKRYVKNDKATFRKMQKLYHEDSGEFMNVFLGIRTISRTSADGAKIEGKLSQPYIPLEPW